MSSTTQILFNSPALRSLKRDQLIKLCKIHSLKATGKNVELIEKLKQHAFTLPRDSPLSIAARSEDASLPPHTSELLFSEKQRPSEQWEVVMDSIDEADEMAASQGTLTSHRTVGQDKVAGEFGTGGSKSSVGSSLMALATSLGLKRPGTTSSVKSHSQTADGVSGVQEADELTRFATPYSHLPPSTFVSQSDSLSSRVTEDCFAADVDMEEPVPGGALRPGVPAPDNARLSMGLGLTAPQTPSKHAQPTTTIRLVQNSESMRPSTPELAPFKTAFDLIISPRMSAGVGFGTFSSATTWASSIYPSLPTDTGEPAIRESPSASMATNVASGVVGSDEDITIPGAFPSPSSPTKIAENAKIEPISSNNALGPPNEPFIFGSPLPKHRVSDIQFREAAVSVLDEMNKRLQAEGVNGVDMDIIKRLHPSSHVEGVQTFADHGTNKCQTSEIKQMFDKKHQAEFEKMEGIDALVKRKAAKLHGQSKQGNDDKVVAGKKRKSSVLIDEQRRMPSQVAGHASGTRVISNGRRSKMIPGAFDDDDFDRETDADDERGKKRGKMVNGGVNVHTAELQAQKEKEREAIRRKLEVSKAKRRSSRQSGLGRVQQKQKPSRFGFLAQAKSIVQSMFGRSKVAPSTATAPTASSKAKAGRQDPEPPTKKLPVASSSKNLMDNSRPQNSVTNKGSMALGSRASTTFDKERQSFSSARSGSPIPPYTGPSTSTTGLTHVKRLSPSVTLTHSRSNSSSSDISSIGSKLQPSTGTCKSASNVSVATGSFGVKKASDRGQSSLSRLHAPTASSLAKMGGRTPLSATSSLRDSKQNVGTPEIKKETALSFIINNVAHETIDAQGPASPLVSGQIFSKPLKPSTVGSAGTIDGECQNPNFASGATSKQPLLRQRTLSGKKPRISRSKVISRLASQRASATKSNEPAKSAIHRSGATGKPLSTPRTRSSLSARSKIPVGRSSHTGVGLSNGASDLLMSAKKRARQSEYQARRQGRMETGATDQSLA